MSKHNPAADKFNLPVLFVVMDGKLEIFQGRNRIILAPEDVNRMHETSLPFLDRQNGNKYIDELLKGSKLPKIGEDVHE